MSNDDLSLRDYVEVVQKRWKTVLVVTLAVMLMVLISTLRQPKTYDAKISILLRSGGSGGASQMAGLASLAGVDVVSGGGDRGDLASLLQSKVVAEKVVKDLKLRQRIKGWGDPAYGDDKFAPAVLGMLQKPEEEGNLLGLRVEYTDPVLAAEIANAYADALSYYWNKLNYSEAQKKKEYIEAQLPRVERELVEIEGKIKRFTMLGVNPSSIELKRLEREFEIQNTVYTMLRKEYETVKLEESKKISPFAVIDRAVVAERPFKPRVKFNLQVGLMLGLFSGVFAAFLQEYWSRSAKK
ncbi:MAG: hypothetical protein JW782_00960 [Candidatus Saganbacteria bacterium]|nr:hypothetical protein [Candidatus Saganbacteria bacterium]